MSKLNPFSQINNSTSKAMYSFSKSNRPSLGKKTQQHSLYSVAILSTIFPQPILSEKPVNVPQFRGIGYGKKIDWDQLNKSKKDIPPPGLYNQSDLFTINKHSKKGFTVGVGRQQTKSQSFVQFDKSVPGPQRYGLIQHQPEGPRYSLRPKTACEVFVRKSSMIVPGPGKYEPCDHMNPEGRYFISKWESSKAKRFDPNSSSRFKRTKSQIPGPGQYTPRNSMMETNGRLAESRYVSNGNRVFPHGNRSTLFEEEPKKFRNIPGPGMYESFSQFGSPLNPKKIPTHGGHKTSYKVYGK